MKDAGVGQRCGDVASRTAGSRGRQSDARNYRIRDLASGREELLVKNPEVGWVFEPHFSPRGDQVAVFWNRTDGNRNKTRTVASVLARPRGAVRRAESVARRMVGKRRLDLCVRGLNESDRQSLSSHVQDRAGWKLPPGVSWNTPLAA